MALKNMAGDLEKDIRDFIGQTQAHPENVFQGWKIYEAKEAGKIVNLVPDNESGGNAGISNTRKEIWMVVGHDKEEEIQREAVQVSIRKGFLQRTKIEIVQLRSNGIGTHGFSLLYSTGGNLYDIGLFLDFSPGREQPVSRMVLPMHAHNSLTGNSQADWERYLLRPAQTLIPHADYLNVHIGKPQRNGVRNISLGVTCLETNKPFPVDEMAELHRSLAEQQISEHRETLPNDVKNSLGVVGERKKMEFAALPNQIRIEDIVGLIRSEVAKIRASR